ARCAVRIGELFQSIDIIAQVASRIPGGEVGVKVSGYPDGEYHSRCEQPRGEVIHYVKGDGTRYLQRYRVRTPTFANVPALVKMLQGCELAEFLLRRGRKVTIVDKAEQMGDGMVPVFLAHLMAWFEKKGVAIIGGVKEYVEVTEKGLVVITREGKKELIEADTIVPALPLAANTKMIDDLKKKVPEVYAIGDCLQPGLIVDAIGTALRTARTV
ncbi:MAG: FAD-dependent oxidoreductase, partial [Syntrophorhabdales bacterium]